MGFFSDAARIAAVRNWRCRFYGQVVKIALVVLTGVILEGIEDESTELRLGCQEGKTDGNRAAVNQHVECLSDVVEGQGVVHPGVPDDHRLGLGEAGCDQLEVSIPKRIESCNEPGWGDGRELPRTLGRAACEVYVGVDRDNFVRTRGRIERCEAERPGLTQSQRRVDR